MKRINLQYKSGREITVTVKKDDVDMALQKLEAAKQDDSSVTYLARDKDGNTIPEQCWIVHSPRSMVNIYVENTGD